MRKYIEVLVYTEDFVFHQPITHNPVCFLSHSSALQHPPPTAPPLLLNVVLPPCQCLQEVLFLSSIGLALYVFCLNDAHTQRRSGRGMGCRGMLILIKGVSRRLAALGVAGWRPEKGSSDAVIPVEETRLSTTTKTREYFSNNTSKSLSQAQLTPLVTLAADQYRHNRKPDQPLVCDSCTWGIRETGRSRQPLEVSGYAALWRVEAVETPGFVVAAAAGGGGGSCGRRWLGWVRGSGRGGHCPAAAAAPECSRRHNAKFPPCSFSFSLQPEERVVSAEQSLETPK